MGPLLLGVCLGLAWAGQDRSPVPVQPGFSPEQAEGAWHTVALGASRPSAVQEGGAFRCFMTDVRGLGNGDLNVTYFHRKDGECVKEFYIAERTDAPGRYTFEYQGTVYLTFVVLNDDFAIMDLENHGADGVLVVVELHGRSVSAGRRGLEAYGKHVASRGLRPSDTVDLGLERKPPAQPCFSLEPEPPWPWGDATPWSRRSRWALEPASPVTSTSDAS
ncbi:allergen Fel d 4-like [Perognathus longimembris pacificus]|uniref:allergen Fel d 4-like n=1 Tax=Perognathus longimembris pacificus TaxID=214514 RepID=UPI00201A0C50|nr:allergen Fel d 4-like [Perognathus longimembris pacificus]